MANFSFNALVAICAVKFKFRIPYATRKKTKFLKRLIKMHLFQPNAFPSKCMIILMFWKIVELTTKNYVDFFYFSYLTKSLCEFLFWLPLFYFICNEICFTLAFNQDALWALCIFLPWASFSLIACFAPDQLNFNCLEPNTKNKW